MPFRTSPIASRRIFPSSRVIVRASSSCRCRAISATRATKRPLSGAGISLQAGNASRAASTALEVSSSPADGNSETTSSTLAGLTLRTVLFDFGTIHSPRMKLRISIPDLLSHAPSAA